MARNSTNVCKLCRREGVKLFLKGQRCFSEKCGVNRRNYPPGQHVRPKKGTDYGTQMREKQKVKRIYGVLERQFQHYFTMAQRQKGNTGENLLVLMERRLDNVVLSLGLAFSRFDARQMVAHGHVFVSGSRVDIPGYLVRPGDEIQVKGDDKMKKKATDAIEMNKGRPLPAWLEAVPTELKGKIIQLPKREDVTNEINEQLIIELCSK
ncbi:MAG: 30S ribosomal protein S4 [Planctomycetota bacterium]|jgi:small subunit ribosomal protein S4|nr:30S ribosomal protein S4 [Planctomycetota bacterium]